uniref:Uncharacterized protein n=1 Tax=viral metagenome TaxID=1070528 RepID=A0A6C0LRV4_9ZZZZ
MNVTLFLEIKNEYTEHLTETLYPFIYEGLHSIYKESVKIADDNKQSDKILLIFQKALQQIETWNRLKIEDETKRIKEASGTNEYLDDLIRAVIKSNIILLTYSNHISNTIAQTFYNNLSTANFIHRCYIECAKDTHNNPYLFYHSVSPLDLKRNQVIIHQNIQSAIIRAVRKMLPISIILKEYLINSINIINESTKVELMGVSIPPIIEQPIKSINLVNPVLEKEIMDYIKTEELKDDQQKIKGLISVGKIVDNIEKSQRISIKPTSSHEKSGSINNFTRSSKNILNINFNEQSTINEASEQKTISGTIMSTMLKHKSDKKDNEMSEKIDINDIQIIEEYGAVGSSKRKSHKNF